MSTLKATSSNHSNLDASASLWWRSCSRDTATNSMRHSSTALSTRCVRPRQLVARDLDARAAETGVIFEHQRHEVRDVSDRHLLQRRIRRDRHREGILPQRSQRVGHGRAADTDAESCDGLGEGNGVDATTRLELQEQAVLAPLLELDVERDRPPARGPRRQKDPKMAIL